MPSDSVPSGPYLVLELTPRCNNNCIYCYNVWKKDADYPTGELSTDEWKRVIEKIKNETTCRVISLTGGEPLLRKDTVELVRFARSLDMDVNLITNGTLLTEEMVKSLVEAGVAIFEVPLLSGKPEPHNEMAGVDSWQKVIDAIGFIKKHGGMAVGVVVVTKKNIEQIKYTLETAVVLDLDSVMFNRFNPGGAGEKMMDELLPDSDELEDALAVANQIAIDYGLPITCNIPIQPCIIDMGKFPYLSSGFCSCGTDTAYYAIDSQGNMRPCNHSPMILGNFLTTPYEEIMASPLLREFVESIPVICEPCPSAHTCQGGCKAAAQVCYGSAKEEEPFFKRNLMKNPMLAEAKKKLEEAL